MADFITNGTIVEAKGKLSKKLLYLYALALANERKEKRGKRAERKDR